MTHLKGLLFAPRSEWLAIRDANRGAFAVFAGWVVPLALLPFSATVLRFFLFSSIFGIDTGIATAPVLLADAAGQYVFLLAWIWAVAWGADWLAPKFSAPRAFSRAFSAVAYALAPSFLLSLTTMFPLIGVLAIGGALWSVWLLRLGLPRLMASPAEKSTPYTLAVVALAILLALLGLLVPSCAAVMPSGGGSEPAVLGPLPAGKAPKGGQGKSTSSPDEPLASADKKGSGSLNLDDLKGKSISELIDQYSDPKTRAALEKSARDAAAFGAKLDIKPPGRSILGDLMPETACGQPRVSVENKLVSLPIGGTHAQVTARFGAPDGVDVRMEIGDGSPMATALAQTAMVMGTRDMTTAQGHQRFTQEADRYIDDRWNIPRREARYAVLVARRFVVSAVVTGVDEPSCAAAAVRSVDLEKLFSMFRDPVR